MEEKTVSEDNRKAGRRRETRRMYDVLHAKLTEEERQRLDWLMYKEYLAEDRRNRNNRRAGEDRRR